MTTKKKQVGIALTMVAFLAPGMMVTDRSVASTQQTQSYICRNYQEYFTVPTDVYSLTFDMYGAADGWTSSYGARVTGTVSVTPGEVLEIKVGCKGSLTGTGGYPDGGQGGGVVQQIAASGGGGSTSIVADYANAYEVVAIAGGAGGSTNFAIGGAAGQNGDDAPMGWVNMGFMDGKGATQSAGGAQTCNLANVCGGAGSYLQGGESGYGGGGGGGYFGGSAGTGDINYWWGNAYTDYATAGGGGSSYVSPTRASGFSAPQYYTGWSDHAGTLDLYWTPTPTTTVATTTSTSAPSSTSSTTTTPPTTTLPTLPSTTTSTLPSWTVTPTDEDEEQIVGVTPFPVSGAGSVVVTNETGFVVSRSRVFTPRWRTRVYVGTFSFSLKATYTVNKKRKTYSCTFPKFSTEASVKSSNKWRWYQPKKGCTLPKELIQQLAQRKTTMTFAGTFTRRWATSGKTTRPDGSKIGVRRINVKVAASESVALN